MDANCTCGSGAHPRVCKVHPYAWDLHRSELNLFNELTSPDTYDSRAEREEYAQELIDNFRKAIENKASYNNRGLLNWLLKRKSRRC